MAKCYKLRYINKIMLLFEFQKGGGFDPRNPPPLGAPLGYGVAVNWDAEHYQISLSLGLVAFSQSGKILLLKSTALTASKVQI